MIKLHISDFGPRREGTFNAPDAQIELAAHGVHVINYLVSDSAEHEGVADGASVVQTCCEAVTADGSTHRRAAITDLIKHLLDLGRRCHGAVHDIGVGRTERVRMVRAEGEYNEKGGQ